jgi:ribosomal protein L7Ae-like RNA K-turn-binding protein
VEEFITLLSAVIKGKIKSLIAMAAKAGKLAAGYSAVLDALEKGRVEMLLYARDISEGTKEKIAIPVAASLRTVTLFTRDELGMLMGRELVGVVGIEDKGFADAVWKESERLKGLINNHE